MALSGKAQTSAWTSKTGYAWRVVLNWTAKQSIVDNKSTISWNIKVSTSDSQYVTIGEVRATINGTRVYYRSTEDRSSCHNGTQIASGSIDIPHNDDGTKSVTMKIEAGIYAWEISQTGSSTFALDTIARASSITNASNVTLGDVCNIKWTPASNSFRYKLKFSIGNWNDTTDAIYPNTTDEYIYSSYTIPLTAANQLPSSTSGIMTATLYTYSDSSATTQVGSGEISTFTVTIPSYVIPTIDSLAVTIDNSENSVVDGWGVAVAGYTKVNVVATASGAYNSAISSFTLSDGYSATINASSLSYTSGIVTSSGEKSFSVVCKDSRGRSSNKLSSDTITFYAYSKPSISHFYVSRTKNNSTEVVVNADWSYSSVNGHNSSSAVLYYKRSNASNWTTYGEIPQNIDTVLDVTFEDISSYNFRIIVTDLLSESGQDERFISTLAVLMDFRAGGKGLGIGKISETDSLEIALDTNFFGEIYINGVSLVDYIKSIAGIA